MKNDFVMEPVVDTVEEINFATLQDDLTLNNEPIGWPP